MAAAPTMALVRESTWRVTCPVHGLDRTVHSEAHATNLLALHVRKDHALTHEDVYDGVDLTAAAATVVWELANQHETDRWAKGRASGVMALWQSLTGIAEHDDAIDYAQTLADSTTPVTAVVPPF